MGGGLIRQVPILDVEIPIDPCCWIEIDQPRIPNYVAEWVEDEGIRNILMDQFLDSLIHSSAFLC